MLNELEQILKREGYFFEDEVKNIPDTCCASNIKALDFDKVKETFCVKYGIGNYICSSDLLIMIKDKDELHLVEMKKAWGKDARTFFAAYNLSPKIRDKKIHSIFLLVTLGSTYNIDKDFYSSIFDQSHPKKIKIKASILCDLSNAEMAYVSLLTIAKSGLNFHSIMAGQIDIINCNWFNTYFS